MLKKFYKFVVGHFFLAAIGQEISGCSSQLKSKATSAGLGGGGGGNCAHGFDASYLLNQNSYQKSVYCNFIQLKNFYKLVVENFFLGLFAP
ncbi:hypothetical protein CAEBREN_09265 [Caenorhabditis brenneri]|uniref:Uncharacterized protein n=1 Tax=Caenorhabditis brenneri TaxID=135651 RepID=G0N849_CAEBE|nr:hypothetical protein CAEBREN_09265 [Caenorhabditis brenneri]